MKKNNKTIKVKKKTLAIVGSEPMHCELISIGSCVLNLSAFVTLIFLRVTNTNKCSARFT